MQRTVRSLAVLVAVVVLGACSSSSSSKATPTTTPDAAVETTVQTAPPGEVHELTPVEGPYGVARTEITLVDESRDVEGEPTDDPDVEHRTLETIVLYPTLDAEADDDTPRSIAPGVFPLVVFSHGVTANGGIYVGVLEPLVAAGYVVALPTFPLTQGPDGWDHLDQVPAQARDVSYIIERMLDNSTQTNTLLNGRISADAVAIAGHSLGGVTSMMFYNTCCRDDRVRAVVAVSGVPFDDTGDASDSYDDPPPDGPPLLLLHGTDDGTVPDSGSRKMFDTVTDVPRALVLFDGIGHIDILGQPLEDTAMIGFLDMVLRDDTAAWTDAVAGVEADPAVTGQVAGGLPGPD